MRFLCVEPLVTPWSRRAEDPTLDKTNEKDAVLIARMDRTAAATCLNPSRRPGTACGTLGARRERLISEDSGRSSRCWTCSRPSTVRRLSRGDLPIAAEL